MRLDSRATISELTTVKTRKAIAIRKFFDS